MKAETDLSAFNIDAFDFFRSKASITRHSDAQWQVIFVDVDGAATSLKYMKKNG